MKPKKDKPGAWLQFEKKVASLLQDFGYTVEHDTKVQGAQTDVFARSIHPKVPSLVVECKYHENPKAKVSIDEVENFKARVIGLRNTGEIDRGYLITNTEFTSDAKAALTGAASRFVFLLTYNQFVASLLNANPYLQRMVDDYAANGKIEKFVDLRVVDTTPAEGTIFDAEIGGWNSNRNGPAAPGVHPAKNQRCWILPWHEIRSLLELGWASQVAGMNHYRLKWPAFQAGLEEAEKAEKLAITERVHHRKLKYNQLVGAIERAKQAYAEEIARRLDRAQDSWVLELLAQKPPEFSEELLKHIAPQQPPPTARSIWERCLKAAKEQVAEPIAARPSTGVPQAVCMTENAPAIAREDPSAELTLLPMQSGLQALHTFLAEPNQRLCVLLGDYGAGKSTIMQRLAWQLAECKLSSSTDPSVRIPLLLNLRDYNKVADFGKLIRSFLTDEADMADLSLPMFRKLNSAGYFILLLDGFDEMLERVTKPDRRRCFLEIAQFLVSGSKIVLSGRPGYFPDYQELSEVLGVMGGEQNLGEKPNPIPRQILCLQLMDGHDLEQFLNLSSSNVSAQAKSLIEANPNLHDLARRPVLTSMIMGSATELSALGKTQITLRDLYDLYTNKWVQREEDKGKFRLLMDAEKKSTFVRYLAMRMHLTGNLTIPFRELGKEIQRHFKLTDLDQIDHFSHDIRTCSFLNRSDDGHYRFIHKSFMEYFVAVEFERFDKSPFARSFNKPLLPEMVAFLSNWPVARWCATSEALLEQARTVKEFYIKEQDFETLAHMRYALEKPLKEVLEGFYNMKRYASMYPYQWLDQVIEGLRDVTEKRFPESKYSAQVISTCERIKADIVPLLEEVMKLAANVNGGH